MHYFTSTQRSKIVYCVRRYWASNNQCGMLIKPRPVFTGKLLNFLLCNLKPCTVRNLICYGNNFHCQKMASHILQDCEIYCKKVVMTKILLAHYSHLILSLFLRLRKWQNDRNKCLSAARVITEVNYVSLVFNKTKIIVMLCMAV